MNNHYEILWTYILNCQKRPNFQGGACVKRPQLAKIYRSEDVENKWYCTRDQWWSMYIIYNNLPHEPEISQRIKNWTLHGIAMFQTGLPCYICTLLRPWQFRDSKITAQAAPSEPFRAQDSAVFRDLLKASWQGDENASAKDLCSVAISLAKLRCLAEWEDSRSLVATKG